MRTRLSLSVRGKRLLRELKRLRTERGMSPEDVAGQLGWHRTKLYRIERGQSRLILDDLDELLELYGVRSPERESLFKLGKEAWKRGWWLAYRDLYQGESFFVMENDAARISFHAPTLLPGLLQTEHYARRIIRTMDPICDDDEVERQVSARVERQGVLSRADPPIVTAVIDEGVLRRSSGSRVTDREQLQHLLHLSQFPHIDLRVVPFSSGVYMGQAGQFTVFEFPDDGDSPVAYQEGLFGDVYVEDSDDLARYTLARTESLGAALNPQETQALLSDLLKENE
ncbi:helix-turn-helix domain-containing protein [Nocardiopsis sp. HNM0947]|uniref:Helix-turn-helix domain-containing protein n=1 Tax=Nocardiopsis coralli TaxID=2772213 RepID=A0ABR9PCD0_9ACTN|nr:helix-turn-helix transcriptional regulator [Nocardiopsis coralli]MBE3001501.1 helix-turn-helix domain-containing protein [Nocardiopsis coralli]